MIDLQSPAIAKRPNHRPCHSPSPRGEGRDEGELNLRERSERHFLYRPFVSERDLSRSSGRQPALNKVERVNPLNAVVRTCGEFILFILSQPPGNGEKGRNCKTNPIFNTSTY